MPRYESKTKRWINDNRIEQVPTPTTTGSSLTPTGVTPGTYGDATHVGQFTVQADGRVTFAQDVVIIGTTTYWERTADDLHLDPTTTAGLETFTFDYTDGGGNRYKIIADTGDLVLENRVTGAAADVDVQAVAGYAAVLAEGQVTDSGFTSAGFLSATAAPSSANTEIEADDGHSHIAKIEVNADNANTPKTYGQVTANEMLFALDNAAPASGDLAAGDFAPWLDDTVGATKLKARAKDSAGTVVDLVLSGGATTATQDLTPSFLLMGG